ncbi:FAD-binding oxidoreductase [Dactylosporangium sp. CA-139114]|uniref:FAD-binding oxidoreductase n=1 Tax=Dactylosporangium sp. CA-139114 TaxID=3239931 RepID=UPI003D98ED8B
MTTYLPDGAPRAGDGLGALGPRLAELFGERFRRDGEERRRHCATTGWTAPEPPDGVVYAESVQDVRDVLRLCAEHRVPLIPFGGGTSIEGQVNAPQGGLSLDLSRLDRVVAVAPDELTVTVQPGIRREALNARLAPYDLFFPVDPGADATLGGMASTRASGTRAVGYGTMRDNVLAARVQLAGGEEIAVGTAAAKSASGYDLLRLFVGAEGTLGVFTELTLRVYPLAEHVAAATAVFPSVAAAVAAAIAIRRQGIRLTRVELLDRASIRALNLHLGLGLPEEIHLFLEISGAAVGVESDLVRLVALLDGLGATGVRSADDTERSAELWHARHELWWATHAMFPGRAGLPTDACVPLSRLAECIGFAMAEAERLGVEAPLCGHVGDGNFHMLAMVDPADADARHRARRLSIAVARRAVELGGTCTGEHGIGQGKRHLLRMEHGAAVGVMAAVKAVLDPLGILNPGKIFQ